MSVGKATRDPTNGKLIYDANRKARRGIGAPCVCCWTDCTECCQTYTVTVDLVGGVHDPQTITAIISNVGACAYTWNGGTFPSGNIECNTPGEFVPKLSWQMVISDSDADGAVWLSTKFCPCPPSTIAEWEISNIDPGRTATITSIVVSSCEGSGNPFP